MMKLKIKRRVGLFLWNKLCNRLDVGCLREEIEERRALYFIPPQFSELKPEAIIYVSCNINQLRDDLRKLGRYEIKSASLFDLFPQTPHIETVAELIPQE